MSSCNNPDALLEISPTSNLAECFTNDCITDYNKLIANTDISSKDISFVSEIQSSLLDFWTQDQITRYVELYGSPAWQLTMKTTVDDTHHKYFVPFIGIEDDKINALLVFSHNEESGNDWVKLVPRNFVKNYPLKEFVKKNSEGKLLSMSREFAVSAFTGLEQEIFDVVHHDLYATLPTLSGNGIQLRDCVVTTRYLVTECWAIYVGDTFKGVECSYSYETETVGCDGAHTTNTNGNYNSFGTRGLVLGGGAGSGDSSSGTTVDTDRCAEDGIGCDDSDDEDASEYENLLDRILQGGNQGQNNVSQTTHPCVYEIVDQFLNSHIDGLNEVIAQHIGVPVNYGINVVVGSLPSTTNGETFSAVDRSTGAYVSTITINSSLEGCTKDRILTTLVHEIIHAQLGTMWHFANNTPTGSGFGRNDFIDLYPTWIRPTLNVNRQIDHHGIMAEQSQGFLRDMTILLRSFNPSISEEHARHMVLSGLEGTTYWDSLPQTERDSALQTINASRCNNGTRPAASFNFIDC